MEREGETSVVVAVVTEPRFTQRYRDYLEKQKLLDRQHRVQKLRDGMVALPVLAETLPERHLQELRNRVAPGQLLQADAAPRSSSFQKGPGLFSCAETVP